MNFFKALHSCCNYDFSWAGCHAPAQDYACQSSERSWEGIHVLLPSKLLAIYGSCGKETCFLQCCAHWQRLQDQVDRSKPMLQSVSHETKQKDTSVEGDLKGVGVDRGRVEERESWP